MIAPARETLEPKILVTKEAAAAMLSIDGRTLQRWTAPNGPLPCVRIGFGTRPLLRYRVADLEAWIGGQCNDQSMKNGASAGIVHLVEAGASPVTT